MNNNTSRRGNTGALNYATPVCQELHVDTQGVICASDTETVGEDEGEW